MVMMMDSVMAPFGPESVVTRASAYQLTACARLGAAMHALHDKHP